MTDAPALEILLIEDNPGDARLIEEMLGEADELLERVEPDYEVGAEPIIHHETRLEDGLAHLEPRNGAEPPRPTGPTGEGSIRDPDAPARTVPHDVDGNADVATDPIAHRIADANLDIDVVLLDLNLPDSSGLETLSAVFETCEAIPVIVLTGVRDSDTGIEAISRGAQEYLVKDDVTSPLLVRTIAHAIERHQQLLERERHRAELEAVNRLNRIGQEITRDVITTPTREDLEQAVCDRLVADDAYRFAWVGALDSSGNQVVPRAVAGVEEGYLDEITITVDESDTGRGPSGRALRTHEIQVARNLDQDDSFEPWREPAQERSFRSSAAIPIVYDELRYGVLNVYSTRPYAFGEYEQALLSRLGDVVAHAIAALERKHALLTDDVLELEFEIEGKFEALLEATAESDGTLTVDRLIRSGDSVLAFGSADGISQDRLREAVESSADLANLTVLTPGQEHFDFECLKTGELELFETVATHNGRVKSARFDAGTFRLVIELPQRSESSQLIERVQSIYPGADFVAQRTTQREAPSMPTPRVLETSLTDRQREVLEVAYRAGFFDWPRTSTGEEIAEQLDISPATFTQHLRAAEQKFFDAVFSTDEADRGE